MTHGSPHGVVPQLFGDDRVQKKYSLPLSDLKIRSSYRQGLWTSDPYYVSHTVTWFQRRSLPSPSSPRISPLIHVVYGPLYGTTPHSLVGDVVTETSPTLPVESDDQVHSPIKLTDLHIGGRSSPHWVPLCYRNVLSTPVESVV